MASQIKTTKWWTTDKTHCVDPMSRATDGLGKMPPTTVPAKFKETIDTYGDEIAMVR